MHAATQATAAPTRHDWILEHYPLVRMIAHRLARRLPPSVEVEELVNAGVIGLIEAIDRFKADRGVPFKSYAEIRIQGAMLDALRDADWVPMSVRRRHNRMARTRQQLRRELGRDPSRAEMAEAMELDPAAYDEYYEAGRLRSLVSLDAPATGDGSSLLVDNLADEEAASVEELIGSRELCALVAHAVRCLPKKERIAVSLYYLRGLTLREIGEVMGVTESRACQLRGQGVKRLKFRLHAAEA